MGATGSGTAFNPFTMGAIVALVVSMVLFPAKPQPLVPPMSGMRGHRLLWRGLGVLWLIDGILQGQPAMFTRKFARDNLWPNLGGQPAGYAHLLRWSYGLWQSHLVWANLFAMGLQLAIGWVLLSGYRTRSGRIALLLSIGWGLVVWVFGEGAGSLWAGSPSFLPGSPGSALLYVLGSAFLLVPEHWWTNGVAIVVLRRVIGVLWFVGAALQTAPVYWTAHGNAAILDAQIRLGGSIGLLPFFARGMALHPIIWNAAITLGMLVLGLAWWRDWPGRWTRWVMVGWLVFLWAVGQDFGMVFSGVGTDSNTALVFALLMESAIVSDSTRPIRIFGPGIYRTLPWQRARNQKKVDKGPTRPDRQRA